MIVVNTLATTVGLFGWQTGALSDVIPNLFVPAGLTFSVWGVLYLLLLLFTVYQARGLFSASRQAPEALGRVGWLFVVSSLANIAWLLLWHLQARRAVDDPDAGPARDAHRRARAAGNGPDPADRDRALALQGSVQRLPRLDHRGDRRERDRGARHRGLERLRPGARGLGRGDGRRGRAPHPRHAPHPPRRGVRPRGGVGAWPASP